MATFQITGPDGNKYQVEAPDSATDDDVLAYARAQFGREAAPPQQPDAQAAVNTAASQGSTPAALSAAAQSVSKPSLLDKLKMGASDVLYGAGQAAAHLPTAVDPYMSPSYMANLQTPQDRTADASALDQAIAKRETDWQARRRASGDSGIEFARGTGAAAVAAPFLATMPQIGGPAWLSPFLNGAAQGGVSAALSPVTDTSGGYGSAKLGQLAVGAASGGATNSAGAVLGRAISPNVDPAVQYLRDRGVQPTVGQNIGPNAATAEDAIGSVNPFIAMGQRRAVKQFNVAALNEALSPLSDVSQQKVVYNGPAGREGIKAVGDLLSDRYNALKGQIALPVTSDVKDALNQVEQKLAVEAPPMASRLKTFIDERLYNRVDGNGVLPGGAFKDVEEAFTKQAGRYSRSTDGDQRAYAEALHNVADVLREKLADANPAQAKELGALNKGWAVLARIEDAVPTGSHDGIFTPYQLARSVETADNSVRHRQYVRGEAMLQPLTDAGLKVLGNRYPNSGTVGRYAAGSAILGGTYSLNPIAAAGLATSSLAYTPAGQALIGTILNDRPPIAAPIADVARKSGRLLAAPTAFSLLN